LTLQLSNTTNNNLGNFHCEVAVSNKNTYNNPLNAYKGCFLIIFPIKTELISVFFENLRNFQNDENI